MPFRPSLLLHLDSGYLSIYTVSKGIPLLDTEREADTTKKRFLHAMYRNTYRLESAGQS